MTWTRRKFLLASASTLALQQALRAQSLPPTVSRLNPLAEAPDWNALETFANTLPREAFERAITKIYNDTSAFPLPWTIEGDNLVVQTTSPTTTRPIPFLSAGQKPKKPTRYWRAPTELPALTAIDPPLKGLHIALDPGHIGGGYAQMEERWLTMDNGATVVMEGSLVLQVANLLKPRLEALGAQVTLVRSQDAPVTTAKLEDFHELAKKILNDAGIPDPPATYTDRLDERRIISIQWQAEKLFYRVSEIRARAHRVNHDLRPDLVLCLHLNAEAWGDPQTPAFVDKNHLHLLVNGCYGADELQYQDTRFEMLTRLFQQTHDEELPLADIVASELANTTQLPPYTYTSKNARRVTENPYVFARNLLASRLYQCPVLYFEPYVMNHEQTYKRLTLGHYIGRTLLDDQLVTSPLEDYTRGVIRGLRKYYTKTRQPS
ncbi:N-acetylmuramoyl-L-alanine amidase [Phragmitibacter flavus]|uniref:N-acetylmuramoyl-L-alanine amidase n=1 Tax=Phragmitibacter flavus TaxID=2576071 RepID=A0A5R8KF73_9BACT|nr:N-acetylmuramoyl-L-alanine amidase [Phragmitibacter flavus]TLD70259.1 N-acetylmuramoyl-L-alanine amidase [Phragmitibacter flavus]